MLPVTFVDDLINKENIYGTIFDGKKVAGNYSFTAGSSCFTAAINIFPEYQNLGIGYYLFKRCYRRLKKENHLNNFLSTWCVHEEYSHLTNSQSTNLTVYLNLIQRGMEENKAVWKTPTGKWLRKEGFKNATIITSNSDKVVVDFSL